ncbi:MAG: sigma 54-interacting transcriptional regulator, partial [SAR324 cluster bacterium]|nr:sigma 54-interacting transcriptional regulator [SAR324 cluster bacterium]
KQVLKKKFNPAGMVGQSAAMLDVFEQIAQVAIWDSTVLIRGESGTGKELIAKAIHFHSARVNGPLIKLNCAALPDNLLESELFGYEKGAFTGANKTKPGRFELADGGTIFLDEIGDTSMPFQAKLLRVLQEGEFERLGGESTLKVNLRVITATHVDLEKAVSEGKFREDLYYRLNVMPIFLPPLRERREDIAPLTEFFLKGLSVERGQEIGINTQTLEVISQCDFPGNVRELENCLRRAAMTSKDFLITEDSLPCTRGLCLSRTIQHHVETPIASTTQTQQVAKTDAEQDLSQIANERDRVTAALQRAGWVQAKAARLLNMTPRQVAYRIQKLKIDVEEF